MKGRIGLLLCLALLSCDRASAPEATGTLGGISLHFTGRRATAVPESLRVRVVVEGDSTREKIAPLSTFGALDLEVPFGRRLWIRAALFAAGDTLETGDTLFTMPSVADLRLVLTLRTSGASGLAWESAPRDLAYQGRAFLDTLRIAGPGRDAASLSLVGAPAGATLTGNVLEWTPEDSGTFALGLAVARWSRIDTLAWSIHVDQALAWESAPRSWAYVDQPFSDTLHLVGAGVETATLSLIEAPTGASLSGKVLEWTPSATGNFPLRLAVAHATWLDTLDWSIVVRDTVVVSSSMVRIPAAGKTFTFGEGIWLDSGIVPTSVTLTGDFEMDPTEVTRARFDSVMLAKYPNSYLKPTWGSTTTDAPVVNIDFTGAVLYCNALSQAAKLDTVFQYDQLTWSNWIPKVTNLRMRPNVRGYRLPTEAEWEFAARGGTDSLHPWSSRGGAASTSFANYPTWGAFGTGGSLVPVGSLLPNAYGLYDMFGNAAEMVLGVFVDGWTVPEAQDPWGPGIWNWGSSWRLPVRGGSAMSWLERTSIGTTEYTAFTGFRTVLPVAARGQGSILPGLVPASLPTSDTLFTATADTKLDIPFVLWDLLGDSLTLSVKGAGPTVSGTSVQWTPHRPDVGLHRFEVTAVAKSSGRVSRSFPIKIQVK